MGQIEIYNFGYFLVFSCSWRHFSEINANISHGYYLVLPLLNCQKTGVPGALFQEIVSIFLPEDAALSNYDTTLILTGTIWERVVVTDLH